jgi:hypothetical protein
VIELIDSKNGFASLLKKNTQFWESYSMIEYILLGALIYGISTGQLKNGKQVVHVLGNKLGYAIATFKRIRAEASALAMNVGKSNAEAKAKVSELKSSIDELRALRYDAASTMSFRPSSFYEELVQKPQPPSNVASVPDKTPVQNTSGLPQMSTNPLFTNSKSTSSMMLDVLTSEKIQSMKRQLK